MKTRVVAVLVALTGSGIALAADTAPLSNAWNIAPAGKAAASGELEFRITTNDGDDPIDISVPVIAGAAEDGIARNIRRALASQLRADRFDVTLGEGANVLVTDQRGNPSFTLELVDSDVENVRVTVQSVAPIAPPTVPQQAEPANAPVQRPAAPVAPGDAAPPPATPQPSTPTSPDSPAPMAPPPDATGGAGAPASAPPPGPNTAPPANSNPPRQ